MPYRMGQHHNFINVCRCSCNERVKSLHFTPNVIFSERERGYMLSPFRLSVCRPAVCNVGAPTQPVEILGNFSSPSGTLAIH